MKRILIILPNLDLGGMEVVVMNYFRNIDRARMIFDFVVHGKSGFFEEEARELGARIFRVPTRSESFFGSIAAMKKLYREHPEYDTVIVCTEHAFAFIEMYTAWRAGVKTRAAWSHFSDYQGRSRLKRHANTIARPFLRMFTNIFLACTPDAGRWLFGKQNCHIINNAIDLDKFKFNKDTRDNIRKKHGLQDEFTIGMVARLVPVKNHHFALDVFGEPCHRRENTAFLIIGDGELRAQLEAYATNLGIADRVIFTGAVSNVHEYYSALDLLLVPSFHEGFGITAVEAQASGLPVLISSTAPQEVKISELACFKDLKDGAEAWAKAITTFKSHKREPINLTASGFQIATEAAKFQDLIL